MSPKRRKLGSEEHSSRTIGSELLPVPTTSKETPAPAPAPTLTSEEHKEEKPKWWAACYDKKNKTFCDRNCTEWILIISYSIMYLIFLSTFTMVFLYISLLIIKLTATYTVVDKIELLTYAQNGVGLSATPTSENSLPLIWYKNGEVNDYNKYISALDDLLENKRRKRDTSNHTDLGPCGNAPYGYGDKPCIIIRINKQIKWSAKPLDPDTSQAEEAPAEVKKWVKSGKRKLWLSCSGYHSYDKEHIRKINYYPDPPGFDPDLFPLDVKSKSPLVAIQISDFTMGISLAIQCQVWYQNYTSSVEFVLYVIP